MIEDLNHYEVLEVPVEASPQQIERAYRIARATYQPGSTATYSLMSEDEAAEVLRRVEGAYAVLSDERLRREYDGRLRVSGLPRRNEPKVTAVPEVPQRPVRRAIEPRIELEEPVLPEDGVYDGEVLRRIRMSRGIEIEEVSNITKIGPDYLANIEANRYEMLPPTVYLRGFLREIARCLKLDARLVVDSYMKQLQGGGQQKQSY